jgi:acyl-ACP thioesterase
MNNLQDASYFKDHLVNSYEADRNENLKFYSLFQWFTEIAWEHAKQLGLGFEELQETNKFWILSGINLKVIRLPKWQDKVKLQTWPSGQNKFFFTREFKLFSENNEWLIAASSTWIIYDKKEQKPVTRNNLFIQSFTHSLISFLPQPLWLKN